jgi:hypothetical protein
MRHNGVLVDGGSHNPLGGVLQGSVIIIMKICCVMGHTLRYEDESFCAIKQACWL